MKAKAYCIAFGCMNSNRDGDLTFFSLPTEPERRRKWLELVDREDLLQKGDLKRNSYLVCSTHFEDFSIRVVRHLNKNALPSKHLTTNKKESPPRSVTVVTKRADKVIKEECYSEQSTSSATTTSQEKPKGNRKVFELTNNDKYVTIATQTECDVGTQTEFIRVKEEPPSPEETPITRKRSNTIRECTVQCQQLNMGNIKIKKEFNMNYEARDREIEIEFEPGEQSTTCSDRDDKIQRRVKKIIDWQNTIKNKYRGKGYNIRFKMSATIQSKTDKFKHRKQ